MTQIRVPMGAEGPFTSIDALVLQHGRWPVLRAALLALLRPAPRAGIERLNDHLLRDIGLGPGRPPPRIRELRV